MKRIIALVLTLAMVFTMAGFSQMDASAKVKKIKAKKKVTVQVGKSKTVKIKVKTTGKTKKAFTVKVSKKKIVKVKKKKGKIIIKGKKVGKCKITIRSKANKKKKKVIKVTVKAADAKLTVKQANSQVLSFAFSKKVKLQESNIIIQSKTFVSGNYKKTYRIASIGTSDNKNFSVSVVGSFPYSGKIKATVKGVNKKAIVKEIDANSPTYSYTSKRYVTGMVGEECYDDFYLDEYASKGYGKVKSVSGLPSGIRYVEKDGEVKFKGTFSKLGVYVCKVVVEDEKSNTNTVQTTFVIGSKDTIVTTAAKSIIYVSFEGDGYETGSNVMIYTAGGSGDYNYNIKSKHAKFSDTIYGNSEAEWYMNSTNIPGTYSGQYEVVDDENSNIRAYGTAVVEARQARLIKGKVTSATGRPVKDAWVSKEYKSFIEGNTPETGGHSNDKGEYSMYVANGKYDFFAEVCDKDAWVLNRTINANATINFKLDVYEVTLTASGVDMTKAEEWYTDDFGYLGDGNKVYLPKGTYKLSGWIRVDYYDQEGGYWDYYWKKAEANITVKGDMTATVTVK